LNKTFEDDPIIPAFNTPEHKYNVSLSARNFDIDFGKKKLKNIGFNVTYKWLQGLYLKVRRNLPVILIAISLDAQVSVGIIS
jgi:hypothetical protein